MSRLQDHFTPYITLREELDGGSVRPAAKTYPANLLESSNTITLLIHGYENNQQEASDSYRRMMSFLNPRGQTVAGVFWPGDSWTGPFNYMKAVRLVPEVATALARALFRAAYNKPRFEIKIVAHSLGCRVVLETIKAMLLLKRQRFEGRNPLILISRVVFMAGAVPVSFLEFDDEKGKLRDALDAIEKKISLWSHGDWVLNYIFPFGESAAFTSVLPQALGATRWLGGDAAWPPIRQERNCGAGHSDYWGDTKKEKQQKTAARYVSETMGFSFVEGRIPPTRQIPSRKIN